MNNYYQAAFESKSHAIDASLPRENCCVCFSFVSLLLYLYFMKYNVVNQLFTRLDDALCFQFKHSWESLSSNGDSILLLCCRILRSLLLLFMKRLVLETLRSMFLTSTRGGCAAGQLQFDNSTSTWNNMRHLLHCKFWSRLLILKHDVFKGQIWRSLEIKKRVFFSDG